MVGIAVGVLAVFAVAAALTPDPRGHGTHEQLGLPPCTFVFLFGRPCPSCGMTTAWSWLARGNVLAAMRANVGGAALGILAIAGAAWLLVSAVRGRWLLWRPDVVALSFVALAVAAITLVQWGWRWLNP
jgi:hypothetical protein